MKIKLFKNVSFLNNKRKTLSLIIFSFVLISFSQFMSGCSGSDEVELTQRDKDSIATYTILQKSFSAYSNALKHNQKSENEKARESFENALKYLDEIDDQMISSGENYFWKQDYNELARSIVEDYLITQPEVSQNSRVFVFASRIPVNYERVEEVIKETGIEPLPDGSDVPLVMNSAVEQYIEFFSNTERGRSFIDKTLYRSGKYFPLMRKILKLNNAPEELIYLSVQESGLNPTIVSRAGAVGLWQFMPATGNSYGLYQDGYRDDRRDFEKSTDAAAHLLKDLYRSFDDWYLAFSGYNAGPGRVRSAIRKSGSKDFWSLRGYLPGETKNYVPSIIALSYIFRDPEAYGFKDIEYGTPISYDRVNIESNITLQEVAYLSETDIETIRDLNPEIMNDEIPLYETPYQLRIPHEKYKVFAANYEKATDIDKSSSFKPEYAGTEVTGYTSTTGLTYYKVENYDPGDLKSIGSTSGRKLVSHECKRKQPLEAIAVYFDVRPTDIRIWNNLSYGSLLKNKQKLNIYLTEQRYKKLYGENNSNLEENSANENLSVNDISVGKVNNSKIGINPYPVETISIEKTEEIKTKETLNKNGTESSITKTEEITTEVTDSQTSDNSDNSSGTETFTFKDSETTTDNSSEETFAEVNKSQETTETNNTEYYSETDSDTDSETEYEYVEVEQNKTEEVAEVKKVNYNNSEVSTYTVSGGDNLSLIAGKFNVNVSDLIEWNDLQSDKLLVGQKLKVKNSGTATSIHVVSSGENLSSIADNYGMPLSQLMEINNLSDDKILIGQRLKVYGSSSNTSSSVSNSSKKKYTVSKGETLALIAEKNNLSVSEIMKWNNLKSDKILVGQVLKLYDDGSNKKVRRKKK
ncbi:MAG: LysM peptidoglycan-binding domain-containing protein [Ignavibacteriae bacterium]|nr:LysM peptidoglycan-binding domain-containing protein [Ignavibacteriota bacterium]